MRLSFPFATDVALHGDPIVAAAVGASPLCLPDLGSWGRSVCAWPGRISVRRNRLMNAARTSAGHCIGYLIWVSLGSNSVQQCRLTPVAETFTRTMPNMSLLAWHPPRTKETTGLRPHGKVCVADPSPGSGQGL